MASPVDEQPDHGLDPLDGGLVDLAEAAEETSYAERFSLVAENE